MCTKAFQTFVWRSDHWRLGCENIRFKLNINKSITKAGFHFVQTLKLRHSQYGKNK